MEFKRWYDGFPHLKAIILLLENVEEKNLELIAQDFLQIIMDKYNKQFDEIIKILDENAPPRYSRWYDKNYNLHTCIEFVKTLDDSEKEVLINLFLVSLLSFIENVDNG